MKKVDISRCHACSLCVVVCPPWQQTRDVELTPKYCIHAQQNGAKDEDLELAAKTCILCGACSAACPLEINLFDMMQSLRGNANASAAEQVSFRSARDPMASGSADQLLIPSPALRNNPDILQIVLELLNTKRKTACVEDNGEDIIKALVLGVEVPAERIDEFLAPLKPAATLVVDNGLLYRFLRFVMPGKNIISLGIALGEMEQNLGLSASDIYIINSRVYHAEYTLLRPYYDQLRNRTGCQLNLDLQRIAQPTMAMFKHELLDATEQVRLILQGRRVKRIIVEDMEDKPEIERVSNVPVLHVAELFVND